MINKNVAAVVIPVYKTFDRLTAEELLCLKSTCENLHEYTHILVGPKSLEWKGYFSFFRIYTVSIVTKEFDGYFFDSVEGYNKLLKSWEFYKNFNDFNFILIFQLDAYIFKSELDKWCSKGYDYIGAPWFEGFNRPISNRIVGVGNGGFSLRNVGSAIRLSKRMNFLRKLRKFWYKSQLQRILAFESFLGHTRKYFKIKDPGIMSVMDNPSFAIEDRYWSILSNFFNDYSIPTVEEAIKFSFEVKPAILFKSNNYQLPFGCHAWEKYDPDFWKEFIPMNESIKEQ